MSIFAPTHDRLIPFSLDGKIWVGWVINTKNFPIESKIFLKNHSSQMCPLTWWYRSIQDIGSSAQLDLVATDECIETQFDLYEWDPKTDKVRLYNLTCAIFHVRWIWIIGGVVCIQPLYTPMNAIFVDEMIFIFEIPVKCHHSWPDLGSNSWDPFRGIVWFLTPRMIASTQSHCDAKFLCRPLGRSRKNISLTLRNARRNRAVPIRNMFSIFSATFLRPSNTNLQ